MHDSSLVAVQDGEEHLPDDGLDMRHRQRLAFLVQVLLHIQVKELENKIDFIFSMYNVEQVDNAGMVQLLQQGHLSYCGTRYSLVRMLYLYLFQSNNLYNQEKAMSESMAYITYISIYGGQILGLFIFCIKIEYVILIA